MKKEEILEKYKNIDIKFNLIKLWNFLKEYKFLFYGLIFIIFLKELFGFTENFVFKYLIDKANAFTNGTLASESFTHIIILSVLVYFGISIITTFLWYFIVQTANRLDANLMRDIEQSSFKHILNLSYKFHLNKKTGSIISQFTRGVGKVESFIDAFVFNFVPVFFKLIISISVIFYFDAITAIILMIMTAFFVFFGIYITNIQKVPQNIANYREDTLKQNLSDVFLNIETVKYFAKEKRTQTYFSSLSNKLRESRLYFWRYFSIHAALQTLILGTGICAIFYFSFNGFLNGKISLGSITLIYAAVWKLIPNLFGLINGYRQFIRSIVDVDALFKMFKEKNEVKNIKNAKKIKIKDGQIEYKNVGFAYPRLKYSPIKSFSLKHINIKIKKNKKIAFVGPSGGGKSTVIKLLYRLFDVNTGQIFIDGQDISKVTQESLRESMSIVPQEPILFDNSIYFNISYANPSASKKEVWKAIKFAQLDKLINRLPNKENTIVGERGVKLSGGEKQRVSIARAILADKKILVLDEATSALDSETEKEIQKDLEKLMQGRTTLMIAHRLSTIMKADQIVVLKGGEIFEEGTHDQLKDKKGGLYKKLWTLQQGGEL